METVGQTEASHLCQQLAIYEKILKVQLSRNLKAKEKLPSDKSFLECIREVMDRGAREQEEDELRADQGWSQPYKFRRSHQRPASPRRDYRRAPSPRQDRNGSRRPEMQVTRRKEGGRKPSSQGQRREERRSYECNRSDHIAANCPSVKCFECGEKGHVACSCP